MTTMAHTWKPSTAQVDLLRTVFAERVPTDEPNREQFWKNLTQNVSNRATFETALTALKARPRVQVAPAPSPRPYVRPTPQPNRTDIATEPGLYRDPADGTLYKLGKRTSTFAAPSLSVYSNKATVRRLTVEGTMVKKGTWKRLTASETRRMLAVSPYVQGKRVLAAWLMSEQEKLEYAVGMCMFCHRGLIDGVSVWNNIGPDCAELYGITRAVPPPHIGVG